MPFWLCFGFSVAPSPAGTLHLAQAGCPGGTCMRAKPFTGSEKGRFLAPIGANWRALAPLYSSAKNPQVLTLFGANWRQFLALIGANSWRQLAPKDVPRNWRQFLGSNR